MTALHTFSQINASCPSLSWFVWSSYGSHRMKVDITSTSLTNSTTAYFLIRVDSEDATSKPYMQRWCITIRRFGACIAIR